MSNNQTSHITVTYTDSGNETTRIYAISKDIQSELDRLIRKPTGEDLQAWLEDRGCELDCSDGPAMVWHQGTGFSYEGYYRDGKKHREDGPALVMRRPDSFTIENYYRDGKEHREDGPALVMHLANGTMVHAGYYHDGVWLPDPEPAGVLRRAVASLRRFTI